MFLNVGLQGVALSRTLRKNRRRTGSPKRGKDDRQIADFGPGQHGNLLPDAERLEQQEDAEHEGNDTGPDHRESTKHEDEHHRLKCMLANLTSGCSHRALPGLLSANCMKGADGDRQHDAPKGPK